MTLKNKMVLSVLIVVSFLLSAPLHYSEQGYGCPLTLSKSGVWVSSARSLTGSFALFKDALKETGSQGAFALMAKRAISCTHTNPKKSRMQPSISPSITFNYQKSSSARYFTQQIIFHRCAKFCFFASDNSPPFNSFHKV